LFTDVSEELWYIYATLHGFKSQNIIFFKIIMLTMIYFNFIDRVSWTISPSNKKLFHLEDRNSWLSNPMKQRPYSEALRTSLSARQEIPKLIQPTLTHPVLFGFITISSYLHRGLPIGLFLLNFPVKPVYAFLIRPIPLPFPPVLFSLICQPNKGAIYEALHYATCSNLLLLLKLNHTSQSISFHCWDRQSSLLYKIRWQLKLELCIFYSLLC
jgi:hypothetical protein